MAFVHELLEAWAPWQLMAAEQTDKAKCTKCKDVAGHLSGRVDQRLHEGGWWTQGGWWGDWATPLCSGRSEA